MDIVRDTGSTLFIDNCAACHGIEGTGGPGFPNIAEGRLSWGDDIETIHETIRVGINSGHPETRFAQMLAWTRRHVAARRYRGAHRPCAGFRPAGRDRPCRC